METDLQGESFFFRRERHENNSSKFILRLEFTGSLKRQGLTGTLFYIAYPSEASIADRKRS